MNSPVGSLFNYKRKVACFSKSYTNDLMWSHYAENYTGMCIEYDPKYFLINDNFPIEIFPILYTNDFQDIEIITNGTINYEILELSYLVKSKRWSYENEWRLRIIEKYYSKLISRKYLPAKIDSITFGWNFTENSNAEKIIKFSSLNKIPLYQIYIYSFPINNKNIILKREPI